MITPFACPGDNSEGEGHASAAVRLPGVRRSYRWLLLYGPWALAILGTALTLVGLFADRPGEVAVTAIAFGSAMLVGGVLLPRLGGSVEPWCRAHGSNLEPR
jgi:hypothetical protein